MPNTQTVMHTLTRPGLARSSLERRSRRPRERRHSLAIPRLQEWRGMEICDGVHARRKQSSHAASVRLARRLEWVRAKLLCRVLLRAPYGVAVS